jgi:hypothetical protein
LCRASYHAGAGYQAVVRLIEHSARCTLQRVPGSRIVGLRFPGKAICRYSMITDRGFGKRFVLHFVKWASFQFPGVTDGAVSSPEDESVVSQS